MKTIKTTLTILFIAFLTISCDKGDDSPGLVPIQPTVFNPNDYSEYVTCNVGDFSYNTGNSAGNTTSVYAFKVGSTLYLTSSDGNFVSGSTSPMEINMQLKNFDEVNLASYEVSGTYPTEILKYKHVDGDNYDTNNGVNITSQLNSITITNIENGFYKGTFSFTTYKVSNRSTTLQVNQGNFKFQIN
jgi:hypothetical protein